MKRFLWCFLQIGLLSTFLTLVACGRQGETAVPIVQTATTVSGGAVVAPEAGGDTAVFAPGTPLPPPAELSATLVGDFAIDIAGGYQDRMVGTTAVAERAPHPMQLLDTQITLNLIENAGPDGRARNLSLEINVGGAAPYEEEGTYDIIGLDLANPEMMSDMDDLLSATQATLTLFVEDQMIVAQGISGTVTISGSSEEGLHGAFNFDGNMLVAGTLEYVDIEVNGVFDARWLTTNP